MPRIHGGEEAFFSWAFGVVSEKFSNVPIRLVPAIIRSSLGRDKVEKIFQCSEGMAMAMPR